VCAPVLGLAGGQAGDGWVFGADEGCGLIFTHFCAVRKAYALLCACLRTLKFFAGKSMFLKGFALAVRLNLNDLVDDLAPKYPPCFSARGRWVEYLKSAAAAQNQRKEPKVILIADGRATFNVAFPFCDECVGTHRLAMRKLGKCEPDFLTSMASKYAPD
jgi:hypothetical protein